MTRFNRNTRTSANKNCNARKRRSTERHHRSILRSQTAKSPVPLIVLSEEQLFATADITLEVELVAVTKRRNDKFLRLQWREVRRGPKFSTNKMGAIVARIDSIITGEAKGRKHLDSTNIKFDGAPLPATGGKGLLAAWNCAACPKAPEFTTSFLAEIRSTKNPIYRDEDHRHYDSTGECMGYGARPSFNDLDDQPVNSSVGPYVHKNMTSVHHQKLDAQHKNYAITCVQDGCSAIGDIYKTAKGPRITSTGTSMMRSVARMATSTNKELQPLLHNIGQLGYTTWYINYNAETRKEHSEPDSTMTLIHVPLQKLPQNGVGHSTFNFYLEGKDSRDCQPLQVSLCPTMSVFFSGFFLIHRQQRHGNQHNLLNVSAYGSKRLYCNSKCTINRNLQGSQHAEEGEQPSCDTNAKGKTQQPLGNRNQPRRQCTQFTRNDGGTATINSTKAARPSRSIRLPARFNDFSMTSKKTCKPKHHTL